MNNNRNKVTPGQTDSINSGRRLFSVAAWSTPVIAAVALPTHATTTLQLSPSPEPTQPPTGGPSSFDLEELFEGIPSGLPFTPCGDPPVRRFQAQTLVNPLGTVANLVATSDILVDDDLEVNGNIILQGQFPVLGCTPPRNGQHTIPQNTVLAAMVAPGESVTVDLIDNFGIQVFATGTIAFV
ncbi:MAG: hypothetical protein AAF478_13520 [Pseudomonadota bacterium]